MTIEEILNRCDHTVLAQNAVWQDVMTACEDAMRFGTASVCIPPSFVKQAKDFVGDKVKVCTVIGFPNGYEKTEVKVFETGCAVRDGADEIDMVINIGDLKARKYAKVLGEINEIKRAADGRILKVIIETCLLTQEEKIKMCNIVSVSDADYIKTSTGFSTLGATFSDIELFSKHLSPEKKIKAAGGISSLEDAEKFISLGADRLGTSRIVKIMKSESSDGKY